jgi:hypothetical protein
MVRARTNFKWASRVIVEKFDTNRWFKMDLVQYLIKLLILHHSLFPKKTQKLKIVMSSCLYIIIKLPFIDDDELAHKYKESWPFEIKFTFKKA